MKLEKIFTGSTCLIVASLLSSLVLCGSVAAAEFSADTIQRMPQGEMQGKFFIKGDLMRQETEMHGTKQVTIMRQDKGVVWVLMPGQMYVEMPYGSPTQDISSMDPLALEGMATKEDLGREKVNGYKCEKYRYTFNDPSLGTMIQWFSKKLEWPVRVEMKTPEGEFVIEYKNIKEGKVSDSLFLVPAGYTKMDMPQGVMPGMKQ